jgi:hypothetical protein
MALNVLGVSFHSDAEISIDFKSRLGEDGELDIAGRVKPFAEVLQAETGVKMVGFDMTALTPYVGKFTGRAVGEGGLNLTLNYLIEGEELNANHKLLIQKFDFGDKVDSEDALSLPFGLALSLLKDVKGNINVTLPVEGKYTDPEFKYGQLVGQTFKNFLVKIVTKPFSFLASVVGAAAGEEEMQFIRFAPGKDQLSEEENARLRQIARALLERPTLGVEINGVYDQKEDWWAIKTDIYARDMVRMQAESTGSEEKNLAKYYEGVFGFWEYRRLKKEIPRTDYDNLGDWNRAVQQEARRRLIENAPANPGALKELAQRRARAGLAVFENAGVDVDRLKIGAPKEVVASMDQLLMELILIIPE